MKSYGIGWVTGVHQVDTNSLSFYKDTDPMTGILIEEERTEQHRVTRRHREEGHVKTQAEIRVRQLQAKNMPRIVGCCQARKR